MRWRMGFSSIMGTVTGDGIGRQGYQSRAARRGRTRLVERELHERKRAPPRAAPLMPTPAALPASTAPNVVNAIFAAFEAGRAHERATMLAALGGTP